jgi:hypothetical protein
MPEKVTKARDGNRVAPGDEWGVVNPTMRALLDHLAEELAAEFIRLIKAASGEMSKPQGDKETR